MEQFGEFQIFEEFGEFSNPVSLSEITNFEKDKRVSNPEFHESSKVLRSKKGNLTLVKFENSKKEEKISKSRRTQPLTMRHNLPTPLNLVRYSTNITGR